MMWNEEKAEKIIEKYKNRFSLRLTFKIIRVTVAIFLLYSIYMILLSILYEASNIGERTEYYQKLAIDWTSPDLSIGAARSSSNEITPFLTQKIEFPLEKRIGSEDYVVSQLKLRKTFITAFTHVEIEKSYPYNSMKRGFYFDLPYHPNYGSKLDGSDYPGTWNTLEKIDEGNVAELAFSTEEYYSPKEIVQLLSPYDLDIVWMPLYMGEMKKFTEGGWGGGGNSMSLYPSWGLSGARITDADFNSNSLVTKLDVNSVEESQQAMLDNMQMMLKGNKKLAEVLLDTSHLQERYHYLNEEGFQAYGAVVTGPVKELLKLKELKEIRSVQLGEITYWNWNE
ncbi:hypothetical protein PB01_15545 [Psychrobacillus glaciei]|uniref:Sigma factor regulator C-terminal domain-containing protein n=1 Tax=Psychrobacillus glaciei TaxID=2283160 RepID=A0A5J6SQ35_9BACI|nr:anti sigma factor C-terminal domain-containing protein [Psychrobacillus glaciei]QFG00127.1 hypothetical protein PB01_15545 [Psychrobacillus glaciei]